jgi:hypothetical protein
MVHQDAQHLIKLVILIWLIYLFVMPTRVFIYVLPTYLPKYVLPIHLPIIYLLSINLPTNLFIYLHVYLYFT